MATEKDELLTELHRAQDERKALIAKLLALSDRAVTGFLDEDEREAWCAERDEVDRAIDEVLRKVDMLLEAMLKLKLPS